MGVSSIQLNGQFPYVSGIVDRPRLLNKLRLALEHKLTLICAPPGYGKTTLAAQFAHAQLYPTIWHTIEERERDVTNLHEGSIAVLKSLFPDVQPLASIPGYTPRELAAAVANHLRESVKEDIFYILDDVHHLTGSSAAETWLRTLVALLPSTCHLILISRALPDLPLTEMIARREVLAIGQDQLRFTMDEIRGLAETLGIALAQPQVQELAVRLEGWPAGTVLSMQPLPPDLERTMLSGGEGPEALFDALARVMLTAQPPGLRDFLLRSSTLSRLTTELCNNVLRLPDSAEWIAEALRCNLFLSRASNGLEYHRLFRSFLQRDLAASNRELFVSLHARAARWFEDNDRIDEAFDHYMAANLVQKAVDIAERVAQSYFVQGKAETLLGWTDRLKESGLDTPQLLLACAKIYTDRYDYQHAEAALDGAERGFSRSADAAVAADIRLQRARCSLQRGEYRQAASQAKEVLELPSLEARLKGRALRTLGFSCLRLGEVNQAIQYLEEALPLYRADGDAYALSQLLQDLVIAYSQLGQNHKLSGYLQETVALRRSLGSPSALAFALNNLGYYYHRCGDYDQALSTLEEGVNVVTRVSDKRAEGYLLWSLGDLKRDLGAFNEALRLYHKALELTGNGEPSLRCSILINASTLRRWQGKLYEAVSLAEEAGLLAQSYSLALEETLARAALWSARAQLSDPRKAFTHLKDLAAHLRKQGAQFELLRVISSCIHAALLCRDTHAAREYLQSALEIAHEVASTLPLVVEIIHTKALESFVESQVSSDSPINHDLKRLRDSKLKTPVIIQPTHSLLFQSPSSLRVVTFGQERLEKDGKRILAAEWRATAAKELFLYLLFLGPSSREEISLAFWPDSSIKRVRSNFHTTLYRARHAVGEQVVGFDNGMYYISPECDIWCDAREFDVMTQQARLLSSHDARTEDLWRKAVRLYRGDFLPSLDAEWVIPWRERFHEAHIEALIGLGHCARARGDMHAAIDAFKRALPIDPYREDIYRAMMNCYADLGEKRQIVACLNQLQDRLRQDLAVEPSVETLTLAESLLQ